MIHEAVELAKASDVAILVLGGNEKTVREEFSRTNLDLCGRQQQLLEAVYATGKPVVLVMVDGRAATINWANKYVPAIIHAWFPGEFMGMPSLKFFSETIIREDVWLSLSRNQWDRFLLHSHSSRALTPKEKSV